MSELNPAKERFAQEVASGKTLAAAYRIAYPNSANHKNSTVWTNASQLMAEAEVLQRVAELQAKGAEMAALTLAKHLARLEELSRDAQAAEEYNAAIKAEELRGKASGLYTERIDHTTSGESMSPAASQEAVLAALARNPRPIKGGEQSRVSGA